ncbi:hypothetical protein M5C72_12315 [Companilactobacillus allii]|uniref:Uncharacterized protein n=1 Tax=Companilactobacillus allii TaxID=1847728 RepID=A0A1P8Q114_9LACO|nr:hypothetical protein [Companilactobacillus allii]APX71526.1 hypothetical protein BTM29_02665 [Companilactobacillus allii]USQ68608.1 hypothetical protein M5C72_12315 [Companilactobacillus allii]
MSKFIKNNPVLIAIYILIAILFCIVNTYIGIASIIIELVILGVIYNKSSGEKTNSNNYLAEVTGIAKLDETIVTTKDFFVMEGIAFILNMLSIFRLPVLTIDSTINKLNLSSDTMNSISSLSHRSGLTLFDIGLLLTKSDISSQTIQYGQYAILITIILAFVGIIAQLFRKYSNQLLLISSILPAAFYIISYISSGSNAIIKGMIDTGFYMGLLSSIGLTTIALLKMSILKTTAPQKREREENSFK